MTSIDQREIQFDWFKLWQDIRRQIDMESNLLKGNSSSLAVFSDAVHFSLRRSYTNMRSALEREENGAQP
jgi:hypothetical protein